VMPWMRPLRADRGGGAAGEDHREPSLRHFRAVSARIWRSAGCFPGLVFHPARGRRGGSRPDRVQDSPSFPSCSRFITR
jgi:hypothetical protein